MCGIVGYVGNNVTNVLLDSLSLLEYRGYDSVGLAFNNGKDIEIHKCPGRVNDLRKIMKGVKKTSHIGIGHTRWATHGEVNEVNAHPHHYGKVTLVHNGIIENYVSLKDKYKGKLVSSTDSEVAAMVIDHYYKGNPYEAIRKAVAEFTGTFALVMIFDDDKDSIYAIRHVSPIVVSSLNDSEYILASDLMPITSHTNRYFVLPEYTVLKMNSEGVVISDLKNNVVKPELLEIDWQVESLNKNGFPYYMEKEINEEPLAIKNTINKRIKDNLPDFTVDKIPDKFFKGIDNITIVACGTAWHAGLVGRYLIEKYVGIPVKVEVASEFIYSSPIINKKTLLVSISQSGETIDTIEAIKYAKSLGAKVLSIINVQGSSMCRLSDYNLFTYAGPEIAVASTKAYTSQLSVLYLLTARLVMIKKNDILLANTIIRALKKVPKAIEEVLAKKEEIHKIASKVVSCPDLYMIGRGLDYLALIEGSLKLKEISYIHSEAYASGELKHGTIALIEKGTPVLASITQKRLLSKEMSNVKEVIARGASAIMFVREDLVDDIHEKGDVFTLPKLYDDVMIFPSVVALQLFAYYVTIDKGYDVDKPRNLAKVVTVE